MKGDYQTAGVLFMISFAFSYLIFAYLGWMSQRSEIPMETRSYHVVYDLIVLFLLGVAGSVCAILGAMYVRSGLGEELPWK